MALKLNAGIDELVKAEGPSKPRILLVVLRKQKRGPKAGQLQSCSTFFNRKLLLEFGDV